MNQKIWILAYTKHETYLSRTIFLSMTDGTWKHFQKIDPLFRVAKKVFCMVQKVLII